MDEPGTDRHSFIVKVWVETQEQDTAHKALFWRGRVTHVPSGLYRYFHDIDEIAQFIRPYLGKIEKRSILVICLKQLGSWLKG